MGGTDSNKVLTLAAFAKWMANSYLGQRTGLQEWANYYYLLLTNVLERVRLVGIGEILSRLIAKVILVEAGQETKNACGDDQLCARLEAAVNQ
mgnify:CR=1 FL=1